MSAGEIVGAFIAAVERRDIDAAMELLDDDIVYDNVPMPVMEGRDVVRAGLGAFIGGADEIEWVVHRQVESGGTVMNERLDRFRFGDRWLEVPVAGVWEVADGCITLWRDYFDLETFTKQQ